MRVEVKRRGRRGDGWGLENLLVGLVLEFEGWGLEFGWNGWWSFSVREGGDGMGWEEGDSTSNVERTEVFFNQFKTTRKDIQYSISLPIPFPS